ncbi:MAG: efflux RND transporter periplasmic adaptor subunit [Pseudomonadota bacterium]
MSDHRTDAQPSTEPGRLRRLLAGVLAVGFLFVVLGLGGLGLNHLQRSAEAGIAVTVRPPLVVETVPLTMQNRFMVEERFAGRIEPARETSLAFELAGTVAEVLVEEGDVIAAGAPIAHLDTRAWALERQRTEAAMAAIEADLELARLTTERQRALRDRGHQSEQGLDNARLAKDAAEARRAEMMAALARIELDLEKATLRAPFAGTVTERDVDEGSIVTAGAVLARLQETARPQARIGLPPELAVRYAPGDEVTLLVAEARTTGVVAAVAPDVDPATRTVSVLIDVATTPGDRAGFAMGEVVRLAVARPVETAGAWLPLEALSEGIRGLWSIYVAADGASDMQARREAVEILHTAGGRAFVRGTFADGDHAIIGGHNRLAEGTAVALASAE